jgi:hypothetical protein
MRYRTCLRLISLFVLLAVTAACSKRKSSTIGSASPPPPTSTTAAAPTAAVDDFACTLLTKEEAQAVQGEPFKTTKASAHSAGGVIESQCYFETPTPVNSIVLTVTRKAEGGRDPIETWNEIFHEESGRKKEKEEGEGEKKPLKIEGLGDEAFWTGTRVGGALFVLKGNCYIRISVGGAGDQEQKTERSKKLAADVLKRLP